MSHNFTIEFNTHLRKGRRGRRLLKSGAPDSPRSSISNSRLSKLMALAIKYDHLLSTGALKDYAEISRETAMDRSHITRLMNLRLLAPDIQEQLLTRNLDLKLGDIMRVARLAAWPAQRAAWRLLVAR